MSGRLAAAWIPVAREPSSSVQMRPGWAPASRTYWVRARVSTSVMTGMWWRLSQVVRSPSDHTWSAWAVIRRQMSPAAQGRAPSLRCFWMP